MDTCVVPKRMQWQNTTRNWQGALAFPLSNKHSLIINIVVRRNYSECQIIKEQMVCQERTHGGRQCISKERLR